MLRGNQEDPGEIPVINEESESFFSGGFSDENNDNYQPNLGFIPNYRYNTTDPSITASLTTLVTNGIERDTMLQSIMSQVTALTEQVVSLRKEVSLKKKSKLKKMGGWMKKSVTNLFKG
ncbi:Oidioi.mRNA.OKI2018_I69.chr1.g3096.t1.cds [Oikopleura dioica]|uniref:Oidioi.mRNA.OKI2018_I69.chr1.g3096.t1.cds n=1 Tax=Oikopleura dioica TaxID=34765 RepID=A0ABN7STR8_OIKDI|nr:Oidioi.mRNA.OKI2018_I69.chr1.g3096.t1.cds [Oikopleura dioica]